MAFLQCGGSLLVLSIFCIFLSCEGTFFDDQNDLSLDGLVNKMNTNFCARNCARPRTFIKLSCIIRCLNTNDTNTPPHFTSNSTIHVQLELINFNKTTTTPPGSSNNSNNSSAVKMPSKNNNTIIGSPATPNNNTMGSQKDQLGQVVISEELLAKI